MSKENNEKILARLLHERENARRDGDLLAGFLFRYLGGIPVVRLTKKGPVTGSLTASLPLGKAWYFPALDRRTWALSLALYDYMRKQAVLTGAADFYYQMATLHKFVVNLFTFLRDEKNEH